MFFVAGTATMHVTVPVSIGTYSYDDVGYNHQREVRLRSGATVAAISSTRSAGTNILTAGVGTHSVSVTNSFVRFSSPIPFTGDFPGWVAGLQIWFTGASVDASPLPAGTLLSGAGWTGAGRSSDRLTLSADHGPSFNDIPVTAAATGICVARLLSTDTNNDGQRAFIRINGAIVFAGNDTDTDGSFPVVAGQQITFSTDSGGVRILQGTTLYLI
jgi:hypothetical protein